MLSRQRGNRGVIREAAVARKCQAPQGDHATHKAYHLKADGYPANFRGGKSCPSPGVSFSQLSPRVHSIIPHPATKSPATSAQSDAITPPTLASRRAGVPNGHGTMRARAAPVLGTRGGAPSPAGGGTIVDVDETLWPGGGAQLWGKKACHVQPETTSLICSNGSGGNVMDTARNVAVRHHTVWARMCAPTGIVSGWPTYTYSESMCMERPGR